MARQSILPHHAPLLPRLDDIPRLKLPPAARFDGPVDENLTRTNHGLGLTAALDPAVKLEILIELEDFQRTPHLIPGSIRGIREKKFTT